MWHKQMKCDITNPNETVKLKIIHNRFISVNYMKISSLSRHWGTQSSTRLSQLKHMVWVTVSVSIASSTIPRSMRFRYVVKATFSVAAGPRLRTFSIRSLRRRLAKAFKVLKGWNLWIRALSMMKVQLNTSPTTSDKLSLNWCKCSPSTNSNCNSWYTAPADRDMTRSKLRFLPLQLVTCHTALTDSCPSSCPPCK